MELVSKIIPGFLQPERLSNFSHKLVTDMDFLITFFIVNSPLAYTVYTKTFDLNIFFNAYIVCGIIQGIIVTMSYWASDVLFFGKKIDIEAFKKTGLYDLIIFNNDSVYLYVIGATVYTCLTVVPESIRWTLDFPGYNVMFLQFLITIILHDVFFTLVHYIIHKVPKFRTSHLKIHHECPFDIVNSRCVIASNGAEAIIRDLYTAILPTFIIGYFGMPYYSYTWLIYYSVYSFWSMYIHSGLNYYHSIHHSETPNINYGLYFMTDYFMGTLVLEKKKE